MTKLIIALRNFANTPKTEEFDWFTGMGNGTQIIRERATEKVHSLADCSG